MKHILYIAGLLFFATQTSNAQFIDKAAVEYEVKTNVKKTMGNNSWEEMMKDNMPTFKTGIYTFTFADNKSVYKFTRWDDSQGKVPEFLRKSDEDNNWYFDHNTGKFNMQKNVFGTNFNIDDSIPKIEWRMENETRVIAGFNCRKAVGKILDSVYVFAFYTDEIMISGGPCSINGLPGLILGLTIPRMYTSFIATKVMVNGVSDAMIKPVTAKKYMTTKALQTTLKDRVKEWINGDDPESQKWIDQLFWGTAL